MKFLVTLADQSKVEIESPDHDSFNLLASIVGQSVKRQLIIIGGRKEHLQIWRRHVEAEQLQRIEIWVKAGLVVTQVSEIDK